MNTTRTLVDVTGKALNVYAHSKRGVLYYSYSRTKKNNSNFFYAYEKNILHPYVLKCNNCGDSIFSIDDVSVLCDCGSFFTVMKERYVEPEEEKQVYDKWCLQCKYPFPTLRRDRKFCSRICYEKYSKFNTRYDSQEKKYVPIESRCRYCKEKYLLKYHAQKYCSKLCKVVS